MTANMPKMSPQGPTSSNVSHNPGENPTTPTTTTTTTTTTIPSSSHVEEDNNSSTEVFTTEWLQEPLQAFHSPSVLTNSGCSSSSSSLPHHHMMNSSTSMQSYLHPSYQQPQAFLSSQNGHYYYSPQQMHHNNNNGSLYYSNNQCHTPTTTNNNNINDYPYVDHHLHHNNSNMISQHHLHQNHHRSALDYSPLLMANSAAANPAMVQQQQQQQQQQYHQMMMNDASSYLQHKVPVHSQVTPVAPPVVQQEPPQEQTYRIQQPEFKFCKKRNEFYSNQYESIWYKSPYKYHMRLRVMTTLPILTDNMAVKLHLLHEDDTEVVVSDSTETITFSSEDSLSSDKPASGKRKGRKRKNSTGKESTTAKRTKKEKQLPPTSPAQPPVVDSVIQKTETCQHDIIVGPFQFNVCSYKYSGRKFKLVITLSNIIDGVDVCNLTSPPFLIKAKKPIVKPGIKSKKASAKTTEDSSDDATSPTTPSTPATPAFTESMARPAVAAQACSKSETTNDQVKPTTQLKAQEDSSPVFDFNPGDCSESLDDIVLGMSSSANKNTKVESSSSSSSQSIDYHSFGLSELNDDEIELHDTYLDELLNSDLFMSGTDQFSSA